MSDEGGVGVGDPRVVGPPPHTGDDNNGDSLALLSMEFMQCSH